MVDLRTDISKARKQEIKKENEFALKKAVHRNLVKKKRTEQRLKVFEAKEQNKIKSILYK
jgi:hypothetical protein